MLGARWLCPSSCRRGGRGTGRVGAVPRQGSPWGRRGPGTGKAAPVGRCRCRWELSTAGPQPVPTGQVAPVARGCLWVQEGAWGVPRVGAARLGGQERALSGSGPDPAGTGAVPAPAPGVAGCCSVPPLLLLLLLCGAEPPPVQPDPGSRPLSRGERGRRWAPVPVSPSPPVAGARHRGAAAQSAGQSRPCPGGSRVCRGGSSSGALWAQSDCPTSLPVQGRTDGWTEDPSHAGSCGAPRKKPGCLRPGRRCRLPRSWLGTALPRPAGDAAAPAQLFGPPFVLGPVPIAGAVGLVVRAPVCCCSSSWTAPVPFAGPAQLWFLFQLVDGSGSFPCPLADGSSSSLAAAPAPRHFQLVCGSSSCLLKRSWLLARS